MTKPPVAPVEGHYALLRDGSVVHPECITKDFDLDGTPYYLQSNSDEDYYWTASGVCQRQVYRTGIPKLIFVPKHDIIATISPADMQDVASGELERLKEALELAVAANAKMKDALSFYADDGPTPNVDGPWNTTSWDFGTVARCALADVANIEGGKNL